MLRSWNCSASLIASDNELKVNMSNELALRLWIGKSLRKHSSRFIASGLPAGQDAKGQEDLLILPSCIAAQRRSEPVLSEVEGLLSVALSFVEQLDFIIQFHLEKVGSFLLVK